MGDRQGGGTVRDQAKVKTASRDITKAVLASPLVIPWPNLPRNYQLAVMQELPKLIPDTVAAYHTARARCYGERKKAARKLARQGKAKATAESMNLDDGDQTEAGPSTKVAVMEAEAPARPDVLDHLVLGINETIKSLEKAIDEFKLRLLMMADRLNGVHLKPGSNLLPTAPRSESRSPSPPPPPQTDGSNNETSPPAFVMIPLHSISPQSLVTPIPQYAATYNSLVWQWTQLARIVKTRVKESEWAEVLGEEREEIKVVPLGRVEGELAALVGLRRLASLVIRRSHPDRELLEKILPKSVLHPPRHALTLPFPSSDLKVHDGSTDAPKPCQPQPHVHYAPLTIKGITTSTPVDANSRKKQRLLEVRQKRVEAKVRRKLERDGGGGGGKAGKKVKGRPKAQAGGTS